MPSEVDLLSVRLGTRRVGTLLRLRDDRITFTFDPSYADDPDRAILSLGFKGRDGGLVTPGITRAKLPPYFANLLPEGHLRSYLAARAGVKEVRDFPLIALLGDDLPGNVRVSEEGKGMAPATIGESQREDGPMKFSLAGVQLKLSALESTTGGLTIPVSGAGGDWIVKLPSPQFPQVPVHEHLMLELARLTGIPVPSTRLVTLDQVDGLPSDIPWDERHALAVRRFDRRDGARVHTEDFAQVFGVYPHDKYERASSESIARVLYAESGLASVLDYVDRLVFSLLIGNGDMHLKNWSLIYTDSRTPALSPAYDYVGTVAYVENDTLGLSLGGTRVMSDIGLDHFARFANRVGVPSLPVLERVHGAIGKFKQAWANRDGYGTLPQGHAERLGDHMRRSPLWAV